jgi:hypothetical protein
VKPCAGKKGFLDLVLLVARSQTRAEYAHFWPPLHPAPSPQAPALSAVDPRHSALASSTKMIDAARCFWFHPAADFRRNSGSSDRRSHGDRSLPGVGFPAGLIIPPPVNSVRKESAFFKLAGIELELAQIQLGIRVSSGHERSILAVLGVSSPRHCDVVPVQSGWCLKHTFTPSTRRNISTGHRG